MKKINYNFINFPKIVDHRGNLAFIESNIHLPFAIKRVYFLYDIPGGATRAGHCHIKLHQVLLPLSGSFDISLDDGQNKKTLTMNETNKGLYIRPMIWRTINNFSSGAVCLALASDYYDEGDYIRDYKIFKENK